jgi:hypothetical protein
MSRSFMNREVSNKVEGPCSIHGGKGAQMQLFVTNLADPLNDRIVPKCASVI